MRADMARVAGWVALAMVVEIAARAWFDPGLMLAVFADGFLCR